VYRIRNLIRLNNDVPILAINGGYPGSYVVLAASIALGRSNPVILNVHNLAVSSTFVSRFFDRLLDFYVRDRVNRFVCVSETCRRQLETRLNLDKGSTLVVYNAIDLGEASPRDDLINVNQLETKAFVLGLVGTLERRKGHHFALRLFKSLVDQDPNSKYLLRFVGSDPTSMSSELEADARNLAIGHLVEFVGPRTGRENIYQGIDLLIVPSTSFESFGLVVIEGLAEGIPVVASCVGALTEVLDGIPGGTIVGTWNIDDWVSAIMTVGRRKVSLKELMSTPKFARFVDPDQMAGEYLGLLMSIK
jgi:glycosyltransferase involved in cell wall biosynthesis